MSYRDVNSAQQAIRRNLSSVSLEPENKKALEAVAITMAAAGKPGEFVTYMQALEKTETQVDLKTVADNINNLVDVIGSKHKAETEVDVIPEAKPEWVNELLTRVAALETK